MSSKPRDTRNSIKLSWKKGENKRGKRNFLKIKMDDAIVHRAFFQYRYVVLNSALSGKQISYLRIRETNERERKRKREHGSFRNCRSSAILNQIRSRAKGRALRSNDEKFALRVRLLSQERAAPEHRRETGREGERWKKKRELIPVNCSELKFAESALSNWKPFSFALSRAPVRPSIRPSNEIPNRRCRERRSFCSRACALTHAVWRDGTKGSERKSLTGERKSRTSWRDSRSRVGDAELNAPAVRSTLLPDCI